MSAGHEQNHPYHLVNPSIWPFFGAISAGVFMTGMVLFMHDVTAAMALIGFMMILATMYFWWSDVVKEATFQGHHTPIVQLGLRYGMALFIASEVMFFAAFFWAFFDASFYFDQAIQWQRVDYTGGVATCEHRTDSSLRSAAFEYHDFAAVGLHSHLGASWPNKWRPPGAYRWSDCHDCLGSLLLRDPSL